MNRWAITAVVDGRQLTTEAARELGAFNARPIDKHGAAAAVPKCTKDRTEFRKVWAYNGTPTYQ